MYTILGYVVLVGLVFGKALFPDATHMVFGDDIHRQYYFYREFFNTWISQGIFPWWNPYLFGGEPFIANPVVNIWYPPNWLFSFLPLNVAYSWHIAFHIFWAMLGMRIFMIWVIRERGEMWEIGGWISGVIFGLSGFFMARTFAGHVDVIAAASWMPWTVWAFSREKKNIVIASVVFALQLLSGYQTMAFFTVIAVLIVAVFESVKQRSARPLVLVFIALFIGVCLAAIQILPAAEFFGQSIRTFEFPYVWHSYGSLEWRSLLQFLHPFAFGNPYTYIGPPPNFIEHSAFVGIGGLALAVLGLRKSLVFVFIVVFGIWVSLGPNAPVDLQKLLYQFIPMYQYLRIPPRHLILVVFGLAGLAGIGFSMIKIIWLQRLIGVIVIVELIFFARNFIEMKPIPAARHDRELIALLKQDTKPHRVLQNFGVWVTPRDALDFDSVMAYGIQSATGYDPSILRSYYEFIALASGKSGKEAVLDVDVQVPYLTSNSATEIDFLNIKYIIVPAAYDSFIGNSRYRLVREQPTYRVYENTTVKPRFYFFTDCGKVTITNYLPNKIELTTDSTCNDTLISSEVWYPGWIATIDGKKVSIDKTKDTFRTLFVPKGFHTIIYEYQPTIFYFGGGISISTMLLLIIFCLRKPRA